MEKVVGLVSLWVEGFGCRGAMGRKLDIFEGFYIFVKLKFLFFN